MRDFLNELTVNQMLGLLAGVIFIVLVAAVIFAIAQREDDPFLQPTPTLSVALPDLQVDPRSITPQAP